MIFGRHNVDWNEIKQTITENEKPTNIQYDYINIYIPKIHYTCSGLTYI